MWFFIIIIISNLLTPPHLVVSYGVTVVQQISTDSQVSAMHQILRGNIAISIVVSAYGHRVTMALNSYFISNVTSIKVTFACQ